MIRAVSNFQTPGMSCPREMRPVPIAPMLSRLLGEVAPKTLLGTMAGKPAATVDAPIPLATSDRSLRRERTRRLWDMGFLLRLALRILSRGRGARHRTGCAG